MLIHTLPPRLMYLVMAIRAASIWRLLTQAASAACRPNSPKVTLVPPLASPPLRGRCCLRCFTRLGVNMARSPLPLLGGAGVRRSGRRLGRCRGRLGGRPWLRPRPAAVGTGAPVRTAAAAVAAPATTTLTGARAGARPLGLLLLAGGQHVAPVDPDLHADLAEGGAALGQAVVDVGPQGVQGHAALAVPLGAGHLGAAEPAGALPPDALGAALHGRVDRPAHRPAERDPAGELLRDALRDQLRVGLGALDLEDVQGDLLVRDLVEVGADLVGLGAAAPDDHARPGGVDVHPHPVAGALDLDPGDARVRQAALEVPPDGDVLVQVALVVLVSEPTGFPVRGDPEPEAVRVDLLSHLRGLPGVDDDGDVAGALADPVGTTERPRPVALEGRALVHERPRHEQRVGRELVVVLRVGDRRVQHLAHRQRRRARREEQAPPRLVDVLAADEVNDPARLERRHPDEPGLGLHFHLPCTSFSRQRTPVARSWERCTRKVRVGANSPSLWPTIASEM